MELASIKKILVVGGGASGRHVAERLAISAPDFAVTLIAHDRPPASRMGGRREPFESVEGQCTSLTETARGVTAKVENGTSFFADMAVLATGCGSLSGPDDDLIADARRMPPNRGGSVLILGTGRPAIDYVGRLFDGGHRGRVTLISQSGLLPRVGELTEAYKIELADIPLGTGLRYLSRWIRATVRWCESQGHDWRAVIDGLKPHAATIWQHLSDRDRLRYLIHARPIWEALANRIIGAQAANVALWIDEGRVSVLCGRHLATKKIESGFEAALKINGRAEIENHHADFIVNCTDAPVGLASFSKPMVAKLIRDGLARPDRLAFGLDVTPGCALVGANGNPSRRLFAIGPLTRGRFFDALEWPRIRKQTDRLLQHIIRAGNRKVA